MADKVANSDAQSGSRKGRSPAYPGIDLRRALELTGVVWKLEKQHPVASETVAKHWKLAAKSSQFLTAISAVKKFGLVEAMAQRGPHTGQVKVSNLARDIIIDDREDSIERADAIKKAALFPDIHADLWRKYSGELPSDANLKFYLQKDLKFTESGAGDFISQFKRTIAFAGLGPSDELSEPNHDRLEEEEAAPRGSVSPAMGDLMDRMMEWPQQTLPQSTVRKVPPLREVPIPIQGTAWPSIKAAFPLTEAAWASMIAVLTAMKPGLVEPPASSEQKPDTSAVETPKVE